MRAGHVSCDAGHLIPLPLRHPVEAQKCDSSEDTRVWGGGAGIPGPGFQGSLKQRPAGWEGSYWVQYLAPSEWSGVALPPCCGRAPVSDPVPDLMLVLGELRAGHGGVGAGGELVFQRGARGLGRLGAFCSLTLIRK